MANRSKKSGISSTAAIAVIVVLVIIAAAGWAAYAAFPMSKTTTTTVGGQTVTVSGGTTVTQTVTASGSQSSASTSTAVSTYLSPTNSSVSFTVVGFVGAAQAGVWYLGQQSGIFKQYVPGAKFTQLAGAQVPQALVSGTAQVGYSDTSAFIPTIASGAPLQLIANVIPQPVEWSIFVAANSTCQTLTCLHGKSFSITTKGAVSEFETEYGLFKAMGWKEGVDYTVTPLGSFPAQNAAMFSNDVPQAEATLSMYNFMLSGQAKAIYNYSAPYPAQSLYATTSFIQQHPDAVHALIQGFIAAGKLWNGNESAALPILMNNYGFSSSQAKYTYGSFYYNNDGSISASGTQDAINFLKEFGGINQTLSATSFISTQFVPIIY